MRRLVDHVPYCDGACRMRLDAEQTGMGVLFPQEVGDRIFQIRPDDVFISEGLCVPLFAFIPTSADMGVDDSPAVLE